MILDRNRVIQKTTFIREQTAALRKLAVERSLSEISNDPWLLKGIKYTLQTAIEACVDLAYHVCAKKLGQAPTDARDSFRRLAEAGIIPSLDLAIYSTMIGFRNRVVHGYQEVDASQVYRSLQEDLDDLERFAAAILKLI